MKYNIDPELLAEGLKAIGLYMKEVRKDKGLTQDQLCEIMGLRPDSGHLSRAENGRGTYSMSFFLSWCAHLDLNPYLVPREISPARLERLLGLEDRGKDN